MSTLRANGLEKSYRQRKVVKDLSLEISSGEVVGLLGPNGAGKTTAFHMIVGLVTCDGGSIHLNGENVTRLPMHARAPLRGRSQCARRDPRSVVRHGFAKMSRAAQ